MSEKTIQVTFNPSPLVEGGSISDPSGDEIKNTPSLWNASLTDAFRYGGDLTRAALGAMNLRGDRKFITVDTKVHMLMPGFRPGIPGWHTDGVPRDASGHPGAKGAPRLAMQVELDRYPNASPRYHLLVTGEHCPTRFLAEPFKAEFPAQPTPDLYRLLTEKINEASPPTFSVKASTAYQMSWWDAHEAVAATAHGWRFLIRVTESDWIRPETDLRKIIRLHNPVYAPSEFGW